MRIRGDSKLNAQAETVLKLRQEKKTIEQIRQVLKKDGLDVGYTTLRDWIHRNCGKVSSPSGTLSVQQVPKDSRVGSPHSLGLLEASDEEQFNSLMGILRILWLPGYEWTERKIENSLGAGSLGVPLNRDGGPDFAAYAKQLGRKRVKSLGDMDFVLCAMWTKTVREVLQTPVTNFVEARRRSRTVVGVAREIRDEMFVAVGLPRGGVRG
ncbi:MAG: hypothetical protein J0I10_12955 [Verrucomicrobia bacterium]|nr:hypothetical protein [Verrucomicrobiota bacterium]